MDYTSCTLVLQSEIIAFFSKCRLGAWEYLEIRRPVGFSVSRLFL